MTERRPRIVRCTIEMELVEFEHFNVIAEEMTDEQIIASAEATFEERIAIGELDLFEWIQAKIIGDNN